MVFCVVDCNAKTMIMVVLLTSNMNKNNIFEVVVNMFSLCKAKTMILVVLLTSNREQNSDLKS